MYSCPRPLLNQCKRATSEGNRPANFKQFMQNTGKQWRVMSDEQRLKYSRKAQNIRKDNALQTKEKAKGRFKPKGALNGYLLFKNEFLKSHKANHPNLGAIELGKLASER